MGRGPRRRTRPRHGRRCRRHHRPRRRRSPPSPATLLVIEGLKQRIEKKEIENSLRDYIGQNPWLLGPEWETYKVETSPTKLLKEARKVAGIDNPEKWPGRLDLALRAGRTLLVVEFMRPELTLRLVSMLAIEANDEWLVGRSYISQKSMSTLLIPRPEEKPLTNEKKEVELIAA